MSDPYPVVVTNFPAQPPPPLQPWFHWTQPDVTLVAAVLATMGWIYISHRNRVAARKQHTINVIMSGESSADFRAAELLIKPFLVAAAPVPLASIPQNNKEAFQLVLNRYEFLAAGIRQGDFDEKLVSDSLRGTILEMFDITQAAIITRRRDVKAPRMYEHLEWLHGRWNAQPKNWPRHRYRLLRSWDWRRWPWT